MSAAELGEMKQGGRGLKVIKLNPMPTPTVENSEELAEWLVDGEKFFILNTEITGTPDQTIAMYSCNTDYIYDGTTYTLIFNKCFIESGEQPTIAYDFVTITYTPTESISFSVNTNRLYVNAANPE